MKPGWTNYIFFFWTKFCSWCFRVLLNGLSIEWTLITTTKQLRFAQRGLIPLCLVLGEPYSPLGLKDSRKIVERWFQDSTLSWTNSTQLMERNYHERLLVIVKTAFLTLQTRLKVLQNQGLTMLLVRRRIKIMGFSPLNRILPKGF